jgi:hypothetical protein
MVQADARQRGSLHVREDLLARFDLDHSFSLNRESMGAANHSNGVAGGGCGAGRSCCIAAYLVPFHNMDGVRQLTIEWR